MWKRSAKNLIFNQNTICENN